jgi:RNA polymerase sigma-70 factor (ECF subfamily)
LEQEADATLVLLCLDGNKEAFVELVERYTPRLWGYLKHKVNDHSAVDDILQETFMRAYQSLRKCTRPEGFGNWLYAITRNCLIKWYEKKRVTHTPVPLDELPQLQGEGERKIEQLEMLDRSIVNLRSPYREIIQLKYHDKLTCEEISKRIGRPVGTIKRHLVEAYKELKTLLENLEPKEK